LLLLLIPVLGGALLMGGVNAAAGTTVWPMYHLDQSRTGNDTGEPSFSALSSAWNSPALDGEVLAEPLVDANLVIVATENDSVYAFDVTSGALKWGPVHLGVPRTATFKCGTPFNPVGITSTPVIDGGFLYVVAEVQITANATPPGGTFQWQLSKIDPSTGALSYTKDITPAGMTSPTDHTDPQSQRGSLAISNGNVVIVWGGINNDCGTYHGYVETVSESGGTVQNVYHDTPSDNQGGIWSPSGPAVDSAGNIFVSTGNGSSTSTYDYGDSVLKLSPTLTLQSFFAPTGWSTLNSTDQDLGSVGAAPLANGLLFVAGKPGMGYLLDQATLPGQAPSGSTGGGGEHFSKQVCNDTSDASWGGIAVSGNTVFVPCVDGVAAVTVDPTAKTFSNLWYEPSGGGGGPPIVAGGLVWTAAMFGGTHLYGLDPATGKVALTLSLPATTEHFATPAAGDGMLFMGAGNRLAAFAPPPPPPPFTPANVGAPSATVTPNGSTQLVFWKGAANHLFEGWYAGGFWHGPADLTASVFGGAAPLQSAPSATVSADGSTQLVFWQGAGGHLFEAWYAAGAWHGPLDVTATQLGSAAPLTSSPTVAVTPDGSQQLVYWRGAANHLFEAWYAGGRWNGPLDLTGSVFGGASPLSSAPTATVTRDGSTQVVFWQGPGNHLFEAWYAGGRWNGPVDWTTAAFGGAGTLTSAPSVTTTPDGSQQLVYWEGAGQHLFEAWYAGGHWNGPLDLTGSVFGGAGPLTSAPSAIVTPDGSTQLVFWQGPGQTLWEAWYTGRWNGPLDLSAGG
jgi:hypothetical protein